MALLESLDHLRALQAVDSTVQALERELEAFPKALAAARQDEAAVAAKLAAAKAALEVVLKRRRTLEQDIKGVEQNVIKYETDKLRVKTNEEFRALNNQIAQEKNRKSEIEDQVLLSFDEEETDKERVKKLEGELTLVGRAATEREADTKTRSEEDRARLVELRRQREELVAAMDARLLARYESVRARKNGVAVVPILRGSCGGCHTQQPPQIVNEAQKQDALLSCEFCGRFLIWGEPAS